MNRFVAGALNVRLVLLVFCLHYSRANAEHFISFIIPCFNCAKTVEESIQSIYAQNLGFCFEVICTDDKSTDDTLVVLRECEQKYPRFSIHLHELNRGGGAARNTCVKHAKGDLIFCLDSDNVLEEGSVRPLIEWLDQMGSDVGAFQTLKMFKKEKTSNDHWIFPISSPLMDFSVLAEYPNADPSFSGNYLFTRKAYDRSGGYPEDCGALDTFGFGFALLATGSKIAILPGSFYWHRQDDNSYYLREARKQKNEINRSKVISRFPELFSLKTRERFFKDKNVHKLGGYWLAKKLEIAPAKILGLLFEAYEDELNGQYAQASRKFQSVIKAGYSSEKLIQRYERVLAKEKLSSFDF
jgi:glycosyltransferase involved in cell wall biosynthesis